MCVVLWVGCAPVMGMYVFGRVACKVAVCLGQSIWICEVKGSEGCF